MRSLLIFSFLVTHFYYSQSLPSVNLTVNNGLPSNSIKCFFKDSRGFLWIGTEGGLVCYNGKSFQTFNETNGLKTNQVWNVVEDEKQNLWISVYGKGLAKYDGTKFTYYNTKDGLINNGIRKLHYSKKHKLLIIATENGLSIFDGKQFKNFRKKTIIDKFQVVGINESGNDIFITTYFYGIFKIDFGTSINEANLITINDYNLSYSSYYFKNKLYLGGSEHFLIIKNILNKTVEKFPCPILWDFAKDNSNAIYGAGWNVTDPNGGLFRFKKNQLENITKKANITSTGLWCLYFDKKTNQLWCGSIDKGIFKVDLSNTIQNYTSSYFKLKEFKPQELFEDHFGNIWIGAKDNIIIYQEDVKTIFSKEKLYSNTKKWCEKNNINIEELISKSKRESGFTCFNITSDKKLNTWVNTTWGTFCFDTKFQLIYFFGCDGGHLIFDSNDNAYFGHMYGEVWKIKNKWRWSEFRNYSFKEKNNPSDISKVLKDGNRLWFASYYNGLFVYENNQFTSLNELGAFKETSITDLALNQKKELLIGTSAGNVYIVTYLNKRFKIKQKYTPKQEIIGSSVSFVEYQNGAYYIGTNRGINIIVNNKRIKFLNQSEGLNDVNFIDCIKTKSGLLYISTSRGLITIDSKIVTRSVNTHDPIFIKSISINNKASLKNLTTSKFGILNLKNNKLELDYNQNNIDIQFINNNIYNANKNVYRYKIIGLTNHWSSYESVGKINLLGVPDGTYTIILQGKNLGTGNLFKSISFKLIIHPPFWKTSWFISFILFVLIISIYLFIRYRIKSIELKEREKAFVSNKLTETKLEALRAQMNPHFTFNAINSIQNFIIDNDSKNAMFYLGEFSKLIRQTLENASEKFMSLETEIQFLENYMNVQKMRFDRVKTSIKLDKSIDKYRTLIPPLILQPFIENAFEHAFDNDSDKQQSIDIHFNIENEKLVCTIRDNGTGFKEGTSNSLHKSFGQKLTKDRLDLLNREFETYDFNYEITNLKTLDSSLSGTEVKITFLLMLE